MKFKFILAVTALLILSASTLAATTTFACAPLDDVSDRRPTQCVNPQTIPVPPPPASALAPGDDPTRARDLTDAWQVLEPSSLLWYKTPYSEGFRQLEFTLETAKPDTIRLAFFSPDQTQGLNPATKPIGRGTHSRGDPDNILRWKASYAKPGVWYALLINNTNAPVSFKLTSNIQSTGVKKCISYWETLPTGEYVYWTDCGFYTGPKD